MKVQKLLSSVYFDKDTSAGSVASELNWMWKDILADYDKLWELRKKLYYKQVGFDRMCKDKLAAFNSRCSIPYIQERVNKYIDGGFDFSKDKDFLQSFVSNYFPEWMWKSLKFKEFAQYNWTEEWWFSFVWNPGKKYSCKPVIQIEIPAPDSIQVDKLFDPFDKNTNTLPVIVNGHHKTVVSVATKDKHVWNHIGDGYMNNEIVDVIDKWARNFRKNRGEVDEDE